MLIILWVAACSVKQIASVTIFFVEGQVFDKDSYRPIENVKIYFIDIGYDDIRSQKPYPIDIGQSDSKGKIRLRLNYVWRRNASRFNRPPKAACEIVLSKEFYEPKRFHFEESELRHDGVTFLVDLKKVFLENRLGKNKGKHYNE